MRLISMTRRLDALNRLTVPPDIRRVLYLNPCDFVELSVEDNAIIIRKCVPECVFCGAAHDISTYKDQKVCKECIENIQGGAIV